MKPTSRNPTHLKLISILVKTTANCLIVLIHLFVLWYIYLIYAVSDWNVMLFMITLLVNCFCNCSLCRIFCRVWTIRLLQDNFSDLRLLLWPLLRNEGSMYVSLCSKFYVLSRDHFSCQVFFNLLILNWYIHVATWASKPGNNNSLVNISHEFSLWD